MQGKTLSSLLFILYISDSEKFFRDKNLKGINIDGKNDLLMLLYADDTVILAESHIDLQRKLQAPAEYCDLNGLEVNVGKTKILTFKQIGRAKKMARKYTAYKGSHIELVKEYTYLGIPLSRTALPGPAVQAAVTRAKQATTATLTGVSRLGVNSWGSFLTLYKSMISSIRLYAVPAWGLQCGEDLEAGQLAFKRLLFLPRGTPGWALRL